MKPYYTLNGELATRIDGHPDYAITSTGNVYSYKRNRYLAGNKKRYMVVTVDNRTLSPHRLVATYFVDNPENKPCVDHINRNRYDNTCTNLRWCTQAENSTNKTVNATSATGYIGVTYEKREMKYRARITVSGTVYHLGYYDTKEDAARAYNKAAEHHGYNSNNNIAVAV